ncbi:hypothetical protein BS17DRAFT_692977, partial [Gyrodon lividus]
CLSCFLHDVRNCGGDELWDKTPTCCHCNLDGHLINPQGKTVCTDWQCVKSGFDPGIPG